MKGKRFIFSVIAVCMVLSVVQPVLAGIADWMPTQEQIEMGAALYDIMEKQEQEKKMKQLQQQQQYLQWQNWGLQQEVRKQRAVSKTSLMEAAEKENVDEIRKLIKAGENVNAKDYDGYTALNYAVRKNTAEVVKVLVDAGAYVNESVMEDATSRKDIDILGIVLEKGFDKETLNKALMRIIDDRGTNFVIVSMLLTAGADINCKDSSGRTPLMKLLDAGSWRSDFNVNHEFVKAMIEKGANVNARDKENKTPLIYAAGYSNASVVKVLLDAGAKVDWSDDYSKRSLMYAAEHNTADVVNVLLNAGANINWSDNNNKTPLMYAAEHNTADVVHALLNAGANINMKDKEGRKAVDYAKPAYFGWSAGNSKLKYTNAFKRLGKSDLWFRSLW